MNGSFMTLADARNTGKRVVIALSGGVDSSVAALILKRAGFDVIGITMKNFCYGEAHAGEKSCCSIEAMEDAKRICSRLGINHQVVDVEDQFTKEVIDDFISEYRNARTPNPCVRCNLAVRFKNLIKFGRIMGADYISTGHYARVFINDRGEKFIACAVDKTKDQSYFLCAINGAYIANLILPLGIYTKNEVRSMAREASLPVAAKRESQEVCFIPGGDLREFLAGKLALSPGPIIDLEGKVIGSHDGLFSYTIGQRKNLGISASRPHYVLRLDPERNALIVGGEEDLYQSELSCLLVWLERTVPGLKEDPNALNGRLKAKIRSRHKPAGVRSLELEEKLCRVKFFRPQKSVCPGQAIAFYDGEVVVGAGTIDRTYE